MRALQGSANAFLTPLLLAGLADEVPPRQIGRAVGTFAAVQTAAVALAPLGGGALGAIDWRLAFVTQAVVAGGLALIPPANAAAREGGPPALRTVFTRRVGLLSAASFIGYASITGVGFLVAVLAADEFGLSSIARGVLLAGFGVAGILIGRAAGDAVDRYGRVPVAVVGVALCAALVGLLGFAPTPAGSGRCGSRLASVRRSSGRASTRSRSRPFPATARGDVGHLGLPFRREPPRRR